MLDLKFIRSHLDEVKQALSNRGQEFLLDDFESLDEMRRLLLGEVESRRQERNALSEEVGRLKKARLDAAPQMERVREINQELKELEQDLQDKEALVNDFLLNLPNLPHTSVPVGADAESNPVVRKWGEPPLFAFSPKPHWEVGENLGIWILKPPPKLPAPVFPC